MVPTTPETTIKALYKDHYNEVLAYCVRRTGYTDAEDVAAEVFVTAWRRIDDLRHDTERAWLFGIARRVLSNRWRSALRYRRLKDKVGGLANLHSETPEVYIVQRENDQEVIDCLQRLRPTDREVLMLSAWESLTAPEIAVALGVSVSAAEQRLHRAKKRLAAAMQPVPEQDSFSPRAAEERGGR